MDFTSRNNFFTYFFNFFGSLVLRSETARNIALIPKNIEKFFSSSDLSVESRFGNKKGLKSEYMQNQVI